MNPASYTPPPEVTVTVQIDGRDVTVPEGRTVAAALMLEGNAPSWRRTRHAGSPRGLFCGIGVCYDCLVTVDGRPGLRGCLVPVADGMRISTDDSPSVATPPDTAEEAAHDRA